MVFGIIFGLASSFYLFQSLPKVILFVLVVGTVSGLIAYIMHFVAIFLLGAIAAVSVILTAASAIGMEPSSWLVIFAIAFGGIVAIKCRRPIVIVITSIDGASIIVSAVFLLLTIKELENFLRSDNLTPLSPYLQKLDITSMASVAGILLAIIGMIVQFKVTAKA